MNKYPEYIMEYLRMREGLEKEDTSMDEEFNKYDVPLVFSEVCKWKGLLGNWDYIIKKWIKDIYKIDVDENFV